MLLDGSGSLILSLSLSFYFLIFLSSLQEMEQSNDTQNHTLAGGEFHKTDFFLIDLFFPHLCLGVWAVDG